MKSRKLLLFVAAICLISSFFIGCSKPVEQAAASQQETVQTEAELKIIASTSWTALMAEAAGAKNVTVIAPAELKHPPEYDFKPSDIQAVQDADWIIMAGYEPFMKKMLGASNISEEKIINVTTMNTYQNLVEQTQLIAEKLGTQDLQQEWQKEFTNTVDAIMEKAKNKDVSNTKVLVHMHMGAFVKSLGYEVLEIYGSEELSPAKIGELAALKPDLIIDNYHNPQGKGIEEISGAVRVELRNFPGPEHKDFINLFTDNTKKLGF